MANKAFPTGFLPLPNGTEGVLTAEYPKSTSSTSGLFIGSPVDLSGGQAVSMGTADDSFCKGVVVRLMNSNRRSVSSLAAADAGFVEITVDPHQRFSVLVDDTALVAADIGKGYPIIAETATAATATAFNDSFSKIKLDGSNEEAVGTQAPWIVQGIVGHVENAVATADTRVIVKLDSRNVRA